MTIDIYASLPPMDDHGNPKKSFEVRMRSLGPNPKEDGVEKAVFVDGRKIDFKIDVIRFLEAKSKGPQYLAAEQRRIEREFVRSVSDVLGRKVTAEEIKRATVEGWI